MRAASRPKRGPCHKSLIRIECLESRTLLSAFVVKNTLDSGPDSLRQAITDANNTPGLDVIDFSIGAGGAQTIPISSAPFTITDPVVIDGSTQPGGTLGVPSIFLLGGTKEDRVGLIVTGGGTTIKNLGFITFGSNTNTSHAVELVTGGGNTLIGNWFGLNQAGARKKISGDDILIQDSSNNIIGGPTPAERNVITAGGDHGVGIYGTSSANQIVGNYIGTDSAGTPTVFGSSNGGVFIAAPGNLLGGNLISGNGGSEVVISGAAATGNKLEGNLIGTNAAGSAALDPNSFSAGIRINNGASANIIGGPNAAQRNIISGNGGSGIIINANSNANQIVGNFIGTNITGRTAVAHQSHGVFISGSNNVVSNNLISGNLSNGIGVNGANTIPAPTANVIQGNLIGTDASGASAIPNAAAGVSIFQAANTLIGGGAVAQRNIISGNTQQGIVITDLTSIGTVIQGNYIGITADGTANGTAALGNGDDGVQLNGAMNTTIGGDALAGEGNTISANGGNGINLQRVFGGFGLPSDGVIIEGNIIGAKPPAPGQTPGGSIPNVRNGVNGNGVANCKIGDVLLPRRDNSIFAKTPSYYAINAIDMSNCQWPENPFFLFPGGLGQGPVGGSSYTPVPPIFSVDPGSVPGSFQVSGNVIGGTPNGDGLIDLYVEKSVGGGSEISPVSQASIIFNVLGESTFSFPSVSGLNPGDQLRVVETETTPNVFPALFNGRPGGQSSLFSNPVDVPAPNPVSLINGVLTITGTPGDDTLSVKAAIGNVLVNLDGSTSSFPSINVQSIRVNLEAGSNQATVGPFATNTPDINWGDGAPGNTDVFWNSISPGRTSAAAASVGTMNFNSGNYTFANDPNGYDITVKNAATINFASSQHFISLTLADNSVATLAGGGAHVIRTGALTIAQTATLDLGDNDLILDSTLPAVQSQLGVLIGLLKSGRNGGAWNGKGLISSTAAAEPHHLTGLAIAINEKGNGTPIYPTFDGEQVGANSILIKYTWNGDADLSGKIDADDYFNIDRGFANRLNPNSPYQGYANGDFDYNGTHDADDYFLIDNSYVRQTGVLSSTTAAVKRARPARHHRHQRAAKHPGS